MSNVVIEAGVPVLLAASGTLGQVSGQVTLLGFYVNNTSSLTLTFNKTSGGTAISGTITPAIGFHRYPMQCPDGLYATFASGSGSVTFFIVPGQA